MTEQLISDAYHNFILHIQNEATRSTYESRLRKYFRYCQVESYDELLEGDIKTIQTRISDYLVHIQQEISSSSARGHLNTIRFFYTMNDITDLNWHKIRKVMRPRHKEGNDRPYTTSEISRLLESTDLRGRCVILLCASAGLRIGAVHPLKISHLERLQDLYKITAYKNDPEEYVTFCSPECTKVIDDYLEYRKRYGELLKSYSPVIREQFDKNDPEQAANPKTVEQAVIKRIVYTAVNDSGLREKKNIVKGEKRKLHEVMQSHGLRKFFETQLITAGMNPLFADQLMGHKTGIIKSYFKPSIQQLYEEYIAVVDSVTIAEDQKLRRENTNLKKQITQMDELRLEIEKVKQKINV